MSWTHVKDRDELEAFYRSTLPVIRTTAKELGYGIGVHGSLRRDLDLIATPWIAECADKDQLARAIHRAICGFESAAYDWEAKPRGRFAASFPVCWIDFDHVAEKSTGHIDLSVVDPYAERATDGEKK